MRSLRLGWPLLGAVLGLALGCGKSEGDSDTPGGAGTSSATAGSSSAGTSTGNAGTSATAGTASGGSASGGSAAGSASGGVSMNGGQPTAQAGTGSDDGGAGGLVDCDPKKILCKRAAPVCEAGQVPSVADSCYGDCVKIERCGCSAADQCPQPEEYTCWAKQHCGPYVR